VYRPNSTRDGYGLGLSIVQRLVKLLNLGFQVHSEVGKGSTFALVLPPSMQQIVPDRAAAQEQPKTRQAADKRHVLLVEDDAGVRDATRMLLRVEGYRVTAVGSLGDALSAARNEAAMDLILTDYHLGSGETGTQVIAALREILGHPVKAVLMTGDTSSAMRELPVESGVKVASKPIKAEELLALIKSLLAN